MKKAATVAVPTAKEILATLEPKGTESRRKSYVKQGVKGPVLGVMMGELRALAKSLKTRHDLAMSLWDTGVFEGQVLATMLFDLKQLTEAEAVRLAESAGSAPIIDELTGKTLEDSAFALALRTRWIDSPDTLLSRAGWNLMTTEVQRDKTGVLDLDALMAKIEAELPAADRAKKEAMNMCLLMIGVHHESYTEKAVATGERLGRWDDRPVPKGCTSSYPPEAIPAMISLRNLRNSKR
jgi:3-methyladenine DNA glycosylase AlkD